MARVVFTTNLQRHLACPPADVTGRTVREICRQKKILPEAELNRALDPIAMTEAGGERAANGERRAKNFP